VIRATFVAVSLEIPLIQRAPDWVFAIARRNSQGEKAQSAGLIYFLSP